MKTVIYEPNNRDRKNYIINEKFLQFSKDFNFGVYACQAYRPETKGKVESLAKCIDEIRVHNKEFENEEELNAIVEKLEQKINNRISTATGLPPNELFYKHEFSVLKKNQVGPAMYSLYQQHKVERKVNDLGLVSYANNLYSVPISYAGKVVSLVINEDKLNIWFNNNKIAYHDLLSDKQKYKKVITEEHLIDMYKHNNLFSGNNEKLYETARETLKVLKIFNKEGSDNNG